MRTRIVEPRRRIKRSYVRFLKTMYIRGGWGKVKWCLYIITGAAGCCPIRLEFCIRAYSNVSIYFMDCDWFQKTG